MPNAAAHVLHPSLPTRTFGRFALQRLLGKSAISMTWLALDTQSGAESMLTMPRVAPAGRQALGAWKVAARRTSRLDHPGIAPVGESGAYENWPFVAVDRRHGITLDEWLALHPVPQVDELALWIGSVLRGLAFAHDAGIAHHDLQGHLVLVNERGAASVMALAVSAPPGELSAAARGGDNSRLASLDPGDLRTHRADAERDVLACGLLAHRLLSGEPALGSHDIGEVIARMAPLGRDIVRLPWTTPLPIPEALRAIVDRSTSSQARLRYRNARTFLGALDGWREGVVEGAGGPVALLLDRLRTVGHLPALPGLAQRVQALTKIEGRRTDEIARFLLPDMALSFELLRTLNSAQVQGTQIAGNGPVLTLRRVVALIGVNGVRAAANSLRTWPGPLDDDGAKALRGVIDRVRLAGHAAQAMRPAGYDGEVVYLVAVLQNLGRLLVCYHFADEAEQIRQLMRPEPAAAGEASSVDTSGLGEAVASFAVLGVDIESFGTAAARHWGLGDDVLHMIRRLAADAPVRKPDGDADLLRIVASAANEAVDALALPSPRIAGALANVAQRYARTLRLDMKALHAALQEARDAMTHGGHLAAKSRSESLDEERQDSDGSAPAPSTSQA